MKKQIANLTKKIQRLKKPQKVWPRKLVPMPSPRLKDLYGLEAEIYKTEKQNGYDTLLSSVAQEILKDNLQGKQILQNMLEYILLQEKDRPTKKLIINLIQGLHARQDMKHLWSGISLISRYCNAFARTDRRQERRLYTKYLLELINTEEDQKQFWYFTIEEDKNNGFLDAYYQVIVNRLDNLLETDNNFEGMDEYTQKKYMGILKKRSKRLEISYKLMIQVSKDKGLSQGRKFFSEQVQNNVKKSNSRNFVQLACH